MNVPVILPGWCLGRGPLEPVAQALGATFVDLPGCRDTPLVVSLDSAADLLAGSLAAGSTVVGWSLGAMVALKLAARHPDKVGRLALCSSTPSFVQRDDWPHAMPPEELGAFRTAANADIESVLPRFVANFCRGDRRAKAVTREILDRADPRPAPSALAVGLDWLRKADLRALPPRVQCPTLLLHGAKDPLMPLAAAQALAAALPDARLETLDGCAHAPFVSDPDTFLARLRPFLS